MRGLFDIMAPLVVSVNLCSWIVLISFSIALPSKIIFPKICLHFLCPQDVITKITISFSSCKTKHSSEKGIILKKKKLTGVNILTTHVMPLKLLTRKSVSQYLMVVSNRSIFYGKAYTSGIWFLCQTMNGSKSFVLKKVKGVWKRQVM